MKLVLYSQPGCCLCDRLIGLVQPHLAVLAPCGKATLIKRDITENPLWQRLYGDRIPVLATEFGRVILEGRPDAEQVQRALTQWAQDASKR